MLFSALKGMAMWLSTMVLLMVLTFVSCVTSQVADLAHTVTSDYHTSRMTSLGLVISNPDLTSERTLRSTSGGRDGPEIHRLGVLPTLSDETTTSVLKTLDTKNITFHFINLTTSSSQDFESYQQARRQVRSQDVTAVIGPFYDEYSVACQQERIPYLVTSQTPGDESDNAFLIELFPDDSIFARSILDLLNYYKYKKVAVIYDSWAGASILEKLLGQSKLVVTAFYVPRHNISLAREALKTMRDGFYVNFISALSVDATAYVMNQALSLSMFSPPFKWFLVNEGLQEFSLEKYVDSRANITVLRLMMDYDSGSCALDPEVINLKRAMLHDAVTVYREYVEKRDHKSHFSMRQINRQIDFHGCTGHLNFTSFGRRREIFLQLMTLQGYRTGQSGTWRSEPDELSQRVVPSRSYSSVTRLGHNVFGDMPLRITTKIEPPFVQWREDTSMWRDDGVVESSTGKQLEGMCIDILKELSGLLGFSYTVSLVPDKKFGSLKPPPRGWTGMVRQLKDEKADLALAPFQMSAQRSTVVDFTKPFMTKGTTVVIRTPEQHPGIFQFLMPLSKLVWSAIFMAFIAISLTLFGVSRVNSDRHAKYTHNLRESFWYIWGTLLRGSLNGSPRAISSRIVSIAWWFFCLIVTSIYTANLAAFLTITIDDTGITSASDLSRQDYYEYGTVEGSQTETFFKHTNMSHYADMWAHMSTLNPESMVRRVEDGFERVRKAKEPYAFIWDSPTIRHKISNDCDLMEVGSPFDSKGYGFAIQKNSPFAEKLSWGLLKLNDDEILFRTERKWWRPQTCLNRHRTGAKTHSLSLETVAGMFLVLLAGIVLSVTLCLIQLCMAKWGVRRVKKQTPEEDDNVRNNQEPCLKAATSDFSSPDNEENLQVYANHSPYGFRSYTAEVKW
ncbi:glutamate receptor ionotropic, kainate 2-like isoform X2 [Littorina saxatilis]|uniref:glutamate receptor ionotropic, kainate 2-like isoform X2 n=1 Tax=Littorina saxatilis TaxID=31220 RepID=UPI0038B51E51